MLLLITTGAYLLFLTTICLLLKGGDLRENPKPHLADMAIDHLQPMQFDAISRIGCEPECLGEWNEKVGLSMAHLAPPNLRGSRWQSEADINRL
jgi:hypothetical protein